MMRVLWSLPMRGAEGAGARGDLVRAHALMDALRSRGHEVLVVAADGDRNARATVSAYRSVVRRVVPGKGALVLRDAGRVLHGWAHARRLARVAAQWGPDVLVETQVHFASSGELAARRAGIPLVLDDASPAMEERLLGAGLPGVARTLLLRQTAAATAVTVSSATLRERLVAEGVDPERVHVLPNGVDPERYRREDRTDARRLLALPQDAVVAAFVGSFQPWHRVDLLLDAMGALQDPRLHLLLAGDGPSRMAALAHAQELGVEARISAPGALHGRDLGAAVAAADIGVLPASNDYGQPMKLLDYAAAGLAIVAPDLAPVREVVEEGRTALLIRPGSVTALVGALRRLVADPALRAGMGTEALARIARPASWDARAEALERWLPDARRKRSDACGGTGARREVTT